MESATGVGRRVAGTRLAATLRPTGILALVALLDAAFLHEIWQPLDHWGIWDWDYQMSLVEAARMTILDHGQVPLWNPWMSGGSTLVGHPLARTFDPIFLPALLFGTVVGLKVCILLYMLIGQVGTFQLARAWGAGSAGATFAALVFSWGGSFALHLTHGHVEWMAYAWVPWLLFALRRDSVAPSTKHVAWVAAFLALAWLDGGPYQYAFVPLMLAVCAAALALSQRSWRPLGAVGVAGAVAIGLAAIQLAPVIDTVLEFPRPTQTTNRFYPGPEDPGLWGLIHQGFFARSQVHDPAAWMPFRLNVGAYLGIIPVLLAGWAVLARASRVWPLTLSLLFALLVFASDHLPLSLWNLLHGLPGFGSLRIPARFNFFVVLQLSVLAGLGLEALASQVRIPAPRRSAAAVFVTAVVAVDLFLVSSPVFGHAFILPPFERPAPGAFRQHRASPYRQLYAARAERPVWSNHWPNETFPVLRQKEGVIGGYPGVRFPRDAIAFDAANYPGSEIVAVGDARVSEFALTPNRITIVVDAAEPDRIVVNQNYHRWWRVVSSGTDRAEPFEGRLSVRVPKGRHEIVLAYRPLPFFAGALVSGLTWAALVLALRRGAG